MRLLDLGYFRIGNDVYAEENGSFGLTTLRAAARAPAGQRRLVFGFVGKSGIEHCIEIDDPAAVEAIEIDAPPARRRRAAARLEGRPPLARRSTPRRVNDYVRRATGLEATAKDFRTWHATVLAAAALAESAEPGDTKASRKRAVAAAMKEVVGVPRQHPDARPLVVRRPAGGRRLRGRHHDRGRLRRSVPTAPSERQATLERAVLRLLLS